MQSGFAKIISTGSKYDQKSEKYYDDGYNKQLQTEQARKLKQYKNNPKYNKKQQQNKYGLRANEDVNAGAESFYFTKSGRGSKFVNAKLNKEEDDMNDVLMGGCQNDDDSKSDDTDTQIAINGAIKLGKKKKLGQHCHLSPCLILSKPNKQQSKFNIRMAAPFESEEYWVSPEKYEIVYDDDEYVSKVEKAWINHYGTMLGYDSIEQQKFPNLYNENEDGEEEDEDEKEEGINGAIKLSAQRRLGRHKQTTPCLILSVPDGKSRKYRIRLAAPFQKEEYDVSPGKYEVVHNNEWFVAKVEKYWVNYYQQPFGYESIEEKQQKQFPDTYNF